MAAAGLHLCGREVLSDSVAPSWPFPMVPRGTHPPAQDDRSGIQYVGKNAIAESFLNQLPGDLLLVPSEEVAAVLRLPRVDDVQELPKIRKGKQAPDSKIVVTYARTTKT